MSLLEDLADLYERLTPQKKWEVRVHPEDESEFLCWVYRQWPAGCTSAIDPGSETLLPEGVFRFETQLDVVLKQFIILDEFQARGMASVLHYVFQTPSRLKALAPSWLPSEEQALAKIGDQKLFKVWEIVND